MIKTYLPLVLIVSATALGLAGCESTKESLGLNRSSPDEFAVVKRAPLVIPTNLVQLPIPKPGAPRPQEKTAEEMAAEALFGSEQPETVTLEDGTVVQQSRASMTEAIPSSPRMSEGEAVLLQETGAVKANPNIREVVDSEAEDATYEEQAVIDKLLNRKREAAGTILDPKAEAERLKSNKAEGRPLSEGKVKTLEDQEEEKGISIPLR